MCCITGMGFYFMMIWWDDTCSAFFNSYTFMSYILMTLLNFLILLQEESRERMKKCLDYSIISLSFVLTIHTTIGIQQWTHQEPSCLFQYRGKALYIIVCIIALCISIAQMQYILCKLLPKWVRKYKDRRRNQEIRQRLSLDGLIDPMIE